MGVWATHMDLVIFIGLQGAGKSTFYRARFAATHTLVSKDCFRNNRRPARRQQHLIEAALGLGQSVVVDNTNPTREDRAALIALGQALGARIVGYFFESRLKECLERNRQRTGKQRVPDAALFATCKRLELPDPAEGFDELSFVQRAGNGAFVVSDWKEVNIRDET
jgi:predicted kinase